MSRHHRNIEEEFRAIAPSGRRGIPAAPPIAVGVTGSGGAGSAASMSQASQEITQLEAQFKKQADLIQSNTQAIQANTTSTAGQSVGGSVAHTATGILGGGLGLLSPIVSGIMSLFGLGSSNPAPTPLPFYTAPPSVELNETLRTAPTGATATNGSVASGGDSVGVPSAFVTSANAGSGAGGQANSVIAPITTPSIGNAGNSGVGADGNAGSGNTVGTGSSRPDWSGVQALIDAAMSGLAGRDSAGSVGGTVSGAVPPAGVAGSVASAASGSNAAPAAPQIIVNVSAMDSQSFMDRSNDIASAVREAMLNLHPINDVVASL